MKIYLLENHELPLVRGLALVRTGNLFDPADKVGLASITGSLIRSGGTAAKTGDQIDEDLENIAASVESQIGESYGSVSFSTLKERTDEVLGDVPRRPDRTRLPRRQARSHQDPAPQRHRPPQRRCARHLAARVRLSDLRPQNALRMADGIRDRRQHQARRRRELLQALLLPGQHHPRGAGRLFRAGNESETGKALRGLERPAAPGSAIPAGKQQLPNPASTSATKTDVTQTNLVDRPARRRAQRQGLSGTRSDGRHPRRRLPQPAIPEGAHAAWLRLRRVVFMVRPITITPASSKSPAAPNPPAPPTRSKP